MQPSYFTWALSVVWLAVFVAGSAFAQHRTVELYESAPNTNTERAGEESWYQYFDPNSDQAIFVSGENGFVTGTNIWDSAKAVIFEIFESGHVLTRVQAFMIRDEAPTLLTYDVVVYEADLTAGPLNELHRQTFEVMDIESLDLPAERRVHELSEPVPVAGTIMVAFEWFDQASEPFDMAIVSTDLLGQFNPYDWEFWTEWDTISCGWFDGCNNGLHMWVEAVIAPAVSTEAGSENVGAVRTVIYPNPVVGQSNVQLDLDVAQHVRVDIFNLLGQRVVTIYEGSAQAGRTVVPVDAGSLAPGVYVVRISGFEATLARKFVVSN